jgi:hypothetical protein
MCKEMLQMDDKLLLQNRTFSTKRRVTWVRSSILAVLLAICIIGHISAIFNDPEPVVRSFSWDCERDILEDSGS